MSHPLIHRHDYRPPAWLIPDLALEFDLGIEESIVQSRFVLRRGPGPEAPLRLDGAGLELLEIRMDDRVLAAGEYSLDDEVLVIPAARDGSELAIRVRVQPATNTALEGLYLSGTPEHGFLLTQCEAEGFRRITFFPDRPDVLARYTVTLRADSGRFPVLLAGGNPDGEGRLPDGRHWARFVDPWPKPSYLFALVAGRLEHMERHFTTLEGRKVRIRLWSEAETIDRCHFAMEALLRAMRWDEETFGRAYDLDVFNVVATMDFNMGAMENKGLNIFNAKYLLIDPASSSDEDYRHVEAVIGHEYFHNWSGNRVTCRDWFELSLKEGFTVFREQSFAADMTSRLVQRIEDVTRLRRVQFAEDAGPLAHSVRPDSYREINNFYTTTIYEKGAELVRMLATCLGRERFRRGTDLYFARHDGTAVTIDDFVTALGDASDLDLSPYLAWYAQAGTPHLRVHQEYDADRQTLVVELEQATAPTPGQPEKQPLPIPVAVLLMDEAGKPLPARLEDATEVSAEPHFLDFAAARQRFTYHEVARRPVLSVLRGFSAPVQLESTMPDADLAVLVRHEPDDFNRWQAGSQLARRAFAEHLRETPGASSLAWGDTLAGLAAGDEAIDPSLLAMLLQPADEVELGEALVPWDPAAVHAAREQMLANVAERIGLATIEARYIRLVHSEAGHISARARARRRLKNAFLALLCRGDGERGLAQSLRQFEAAPAMTDRLAALAWMLRLDPARAEPGLQHFRRHHDADPLALDKWFTVQATVPAEGTLARVRALLDDPRFSLRNPNKVFALLATFSRANPHGFHRADGGGVALLAELVARIDPLNSQVAARLANGFDGWQRLEPGRQAFARQALETLAARAGNSRGLQEMITRLRGTA